MGVNSLPKTVTRQHRDCDLNPGPSAPESSTLTTRLPSHPGRFIKLTGSVLFEKHDKSSPFNRTLYVVFYPQNGDRIVTIDSVTSLHSMMYTDR